MKCRIWLLALVGGLSFLFCKPLSAKTLYVADNGSNTDGLTWETAFATIQSAVDAAVAEPDPVTILVGSAGTGHGTGYYTENITLSLPNLTLQSESGYQQTTIQSGSASAHAVTVSSNSITVRGFSIFGSTTNSAGIALVGVNACTIEDNRCGWIDTEYRRNHRGIFLSGGGEHTIQNNLCSYNTYAGIFLSSTSGNRIQSNTCSNCGSAGGIAIQTNSQLNRIIGNLCQANTGNGIDLDSSNLNTLAQNTCTQNDYYPAISLSAAQNNVVTENLCTNNVYGIELTNTANYNSITCNLTQNNLYDGIQLKGSNNQVVANISRSNYQGMYVYQCKENTIYRNTFSSNTSRQVNAYYTLIGSGDLWNSVIPFCYAYNDSICSGKMGSHYSNYTGSDSNGDGIGEDPYTPTASGSLTKQDLYPLMDPDTTYAVQAWYLAEDQTMTMDPNQPGALQTLAGSSSLVWISDTAALEEIAFNALDGTDGWNGQIRFSASFAGNTIQIQVGYVDPNEGIFISGGPTVTLSGTASIFTYETTGQSFSVQEDHYLALQITNTSATARQFYVGGAWTYISAPSETQTPWPGAGEQPPVPPANPADLDGDGWVDMEDMACLSAQWGRTDCGELNYYCDYADIDQTGQIGLGDLEIMAIRWLMGPDDQLPDNPADLDEDSWVNMEDMAWLSAQWGLTDCEELNNNCQGADIDKSGQVGLGDLELLATFWLMKPNEWLAGDWNEDFRVNMDDAALLSDAWTGDLSQLVDLCENWLKGCYVSEPGDEPIE